MIRKWIMLMLLFAASMAVYSQKLDPTKWEVSFSKSQVKVGETVDVILKISIEDPWHFYAPGEEPPQAEITFEESSGFQPVGKIKEGPGIKEKYDEDLEKNIRYYEKSAVFKQTVKITSANPVIKIEVNGQACKEGQCIPVRKKLTGEGLKVVAMNSQDNSKEAGAEKDKSTSKAREAGKVQTQAPQAGNTEESSLESLEAAKEKLTRKDKNGKDETTTYLKEFVHKYGGDQ